MTSPNASRESVIRVKPFHFVHVLDSNTNVTRLEVGPQTITLKDHEELVLQPAKMVTVPPRHFCIIANPVVVENGKAVIDQHGQAKLRLGDKEIRFEQPEPFPLYPGEELVGARVSPLTVVEPDTALRLRAVREFNDTPDAKEPVDRKAGEGAPDAKPIARRPGDEWFFFGPSTYRPRIEVEVVETVRAVVIKPNTALRLRARKECKDHTGTTRKAGEEWLVRDTGAYLPGVDEVVVTEVAAAVLTDKTALHLRAIRSFTDVHKKERKAGDEWLVTLQMAETHIPDVYEEVVGVVAITTLNDRQWCIVVNPIGSDGKPQLGKREVRKGLTSFFLHPGEELEGDAVRDVIVLKEDEALLLEATEAFAEGADPSSKHKAGDRWMIRGPADYIPPATVRIVERRSAIPLDKNEGIYVRDLRTGKVRLVRGQTYLLAEHEQLWEKPLPPVVEELLGSGHDPLAERSAYHADTGAALRRAAVTFRQEEPAQREPSPVQRNRTRAVRFNVPQNAACQVYNFETGSSRVVFGPDLVILEPDEEFTVLSLSGEKPKVPNKIKALALLLGPDFMTDHVVVETADHTQLTVELSCNWQFDVDRSTPAAASRLFQVPDFVGDACKSVASRVRSAVAAVPFDEFHRNSARIIRAAVFGLDEHEKVKDRFNFPANGLVITNIDIRKVEPVDNETRKSLMESVKLAIKITTDAQKAEAELKASLQQQEGEAELTDRKLAASQKSEEERRKLLGLEAQSAAVKATGLAIATAKAEAEAQGIRGNAEVARAQQEVAAAKIRQDAELAHKKAQQEADLAFQKQRNQLEVGHAKAMAAIETESLKDSMEAVKPETLVALAKAGPEHRVELLRALGIKATVFTDGKTPINFLALSQALVGENGGTGTGVLPLPQPVQR